MIAPLRAKGWYQRFTPVSWLASKDLRPTQQSAFPVSSGRLLFPRLQLRGSAGFHTRFPVLTAVMRTREPKNVTERTDLGEG